MNEIIWHPFPDEMPEKGKRYLVTHRTRGVETVTFDGMDSPQTEYDREVIAWADIPEAYTESED